MPLQNRVTPLGELIADPARGLVYGNRGLPARRRRPDSPALRREALDRVQARVQGLEADEAAATGPVHRALLPRRGDGVRRRPPAVRALPARGLRPLRRARRRAGRRDRRAPPRGAARRIAAAPAARARLRELPDGAFVLDQDEPWLVLGDELRRWTPSGYAERRPRTGGDAVLITPPSLVDVLRSGWQGSVPLLHPSA